MNTMLSLEHKIPPPIVGAIVALAMWGVSAYGPQMPLTGWVTHAAVGILAASGLLFDVFGILAFRRFRTTVNPLKPERASAMVTGGVYGISRNPMYLGMGLLLLAWAVYLSALLAFVGPVVYVLYITRFQIVPEERVLKGIFGDAYVAYAARVRRWL